MSQRRGPPHLLHSKMNIMEPLTEKILLEKITALQRTVSQLEEQLDASQSLSLERLLGPLRARQVVLVHVGKDKEDTLLDIAVDCGQQVSEGIRSALFDLNHAPVSPEVRHAMQKAFNNGMNRF